MFATDQSHEEALSLCASDSVKLFVATLLVHRLVHLEQVYNSDNQACQCDHHDVKPHSISHTSTLTQQTTKSYQPKLELTDSTKTALLQITKLSAKIQVASGDPGYVNHGRGGTVATDNVIFDMQA